MLIVVAEKRVSRNALVTVLLAIELPHVNWDLVGLKRLHRLGNSANLRGKAVGDQK